MSTLFEYRRSLMQNSSMHLLSFRPFFIVAAFVLVGIARWSSHPTMAQEVKQASGTSPKSQKGGVGGQPAIGSLPGRLRLKNGDFIDGNLSPAMQSGRIGWKNGSFANTVEFDIAAVRSVDAPAEIEQRIARGQFAIQTHHGDRLWGAIESWEKEKVQIRSEALGLVEIKPNLIRHVRRWGEDPKVLYQGPRSLKDWHVLDENLNWTMESGSLVATDNGAKIRGSVGLTSRVQIDVRISWNRQPNFVLSLGVAENQVNSGTAFSIEVWDKMLAMVRDVDAKADAAYLEPLDEKKAFIELTIYLDQIAGRAIVYSDHGKQLADITLAATDPKAFPCILLENFGKELRLDMIRVLPWKDQLPSEPKSSKTENEPSDSRETVDYVVDIHGKVIHGKPIGIQDGFLLLSLRDGKEERISISEIEECVQGPPVYTEEDRLALANQFPSMLTARKLLKQAEKYLAERDANQAIVSYEKSWSEWAKVFKQFPEVISSPEGKEIYQAIRSYQKNLDADLPLSFPLTKFYDYQQKAEKGNLDADARQWLEQIQREATANVGQEAVTVVLQDQTRMIGTWVENDSNQIVLQPECSLKPVKLSIHDLAAMRGSLMDYPLPKLDTLHEGQLLIDGVQLSGTFGVSENPKEGTCLAWRPRIGRNEVRLSTSANGRFDFRRVDQRVALPTASRPVVGNNRGLMGASATSSSSTLPNLRKAASPNITLRTGDLINAETIGIDEKGIQFKSSTTSTTRIPHDMIQSIEMRRIRRDRTQAAQKMSRLLTVPRQRKDDPPTHLISSVDGDFLRGRLLRMDDKNIVMEVRLQEVSMPTENIAQIVWLHDRNWDDRKVKAKEEAKQEETKQAETFQESKPVFDANTFQVHAVERSGWKLTFEPLRLDEENLYGRSSLLGECSVSIKTIDVLLVGTAIDQRARELATNPWLLSLAKLPKVYEEEMGESGSSPGTLSPLVGKPAPKLDAEYLDGEPFRLSDLKGKVVVLDFWASWCGPCIQTMPLVDQAVKSFESNEVELIAVNLEEPADRAKAALERLKLDTKVVLDLDGVAGRRYLANAIPQTVIIDREGNVTHVFVGGGSKLVEQIRSSLEGILKP